MYHASNAPFNILKVHCKHFYKSGRRGSNSRPLAWKANALSTELLPQKQTASRQLINVLIRRLQPRSVRQKVGRDGFEPPKAYASRFTVCPIWPLWYLPNIFVYGCVISLQNFGADGGIRTHDPEITNHVLWPTELHRH